jgi:tetratricopeptide (TPR) repeat protein
VIYKILFVSVLIFSAASLPLSGVANPYRLAQASQHVAQLDTLFADLKMAPNEAVSRRIERKIWQLWSTPDDPELNAVMTKVFKARNGYNYDGALSLLETVIERWPSYPEGWNQRATLYFLKQDYERSLIAIAETLRLEPRHFGAMAGRAVIRLRQSKPALALQNVKQAMTYHPYLRERHMFPSLSK